MPNEEVDEAPEPCVWKVLVKLGSRLFPWRSLSSVIGNPAIPLFEPCLQASCFDTRAAGPKISEIGPVERPLRERCSLGGAPFFALARLRRFLARR